MAASDKAQAARAAAEWEETGAGEISERTWMIAGGVILLLGAFLRVYNLTLTPLHHDEGVNGFFLQRLINEGIYNYDPANYHGPTLYYLTLVSTSLNSFLYGHSGLSTVAIRLVPALFGVATIWLVLCLRSHLGSLATLIAAALIALSPGAVYMSRYFIHESLFVFFTLGIVVVWLNYYESEPPSEPRAQLGLVVVAASAALVISTLGAVYKPAHFRLEVIMIVLSFGVMATTLWLYDGERCIYLMLAAIAAALLFATKETAIISLGVLLIAAVSSFIYVHLRQPAVVVQAKKKKQKGQRKRMAARVRFGSQLQQALARFGGPVHLLVLLLAALALIATVAALFYSSFFTNSKGVADAFETFKIWTKTGTKDHTQPWYRYASWLAAEESPLLLLGGAGIVLAVWKAANRFIVFAALWAFGIIAAYSLIPYKTPWLALNFIVPLAIIGGYGVEALYRLSTDAIERMVLLAFVVAALATSAVQTVSLNFLHYDDDKYVYVYAHTVRGFLPLMDDISRMAKLTGTGTETGITVVSPDYWPLPWYLRDYKKVGYFGRMAAPSEPIIIASETQEAELSSMYGINDRYRRINSYPLRPGVRLLLYVRRDVADKESRPASNNTEELIPPAQK